MLSLVPGWRDARARAAEPARRPALPPAIVHGDFRLGNWSRQAGAHHRRDRLGDLGVRGIRHVDAGWFLIDCDPLPTYRRPTALCRSSAACRRTGGNLPPRRWEARCRNWTWFCALACFKSTATWSLIVKHNRRRDTRRGEWKRWHRWSHTCYQRVGELLG